MEPSDLIDRAIADFIATATPRQPPDVADCFVGDVDGATFVFLRRASRIVIAIYMVREAGLEHAVLERVHDEQCFVMLQAIEDGDQGAARLAADGNAWNFVPSIATVVGAWYVSTIREPGNARVYRVSQRTGELVDVDEQECARVVAAIGASDARRRVPDAPPDPADPIVGFRIQSADGSPGVRVTVDPGVAENEIELRLRGEKLAGVDLAEQNALTPGERTVWAAAFALALRAYAEGQTPNGTHAERAAGDADDAVDALRSTAAGRFRGEVVGTEQATGEITELPCEVCGRVAPLEEVWASLAGDRIVHTCSSSECLAKAKDLDRAATTSVSGPGDGTIEP